MSEVRPMPVLVDSHAHLDFQDFDHDRSLVLARARQAGLKWIVSIGSGDGIKSAHQSLKLAMENDFIFSTAGLHPHDARLWNAEVRDELIHLAQQPRQVAIGEIGLDFAKEYSPREVQEKVFREQLEIALELDKPAVIHSRNAHGESLKILKDSKIKRVVMHCYSGSAELAQTLVKMGFYISLPGVLTFKNARQLVEVAKDIPLSHLLLETDCPFLAPEPHRGQRNEPAYVRLVADKLAALKGISVEEVGARTTANAEAVFGLGKA
jgi:TatD DNase family protein